MNSSPTPLDVPNTLAEGSAPRTLNVLDQLGLWSNLAISLLGFAGAIVILNPLGNPGMHGMGTAQAIFALVLGTILGMAGVALTAFASSQQGQPAMVLLRGLFGGKLSIIPSLLNAFQLVGWGAFGFVTIGMALHTVCPLPKPVLIIFVGVCSTLLCLYPLRWIRTFRKYVTTAVVVVLVYFAATLGTRDIPANPGHGWGGFMLAVDSIIALSVSWMPVAGDYARHSTSDKGAAWTSIIGYGLTQIAVYSMGVMMLLQTHGDSSKIFSVQLSVTAGTLCFWFLALREIDPCFVDIYSTTVSIQNVRPRWDRRIIAAVIGTIATILALSIDMFSFASFLSLVGSVFTPLMGILLVDYFVFNRGRTWDSAEDAPSRPWMLLPWFIGFMTYQMISPGQVAYWSHMVRELDSALSFTPPSWMSANLISFAIAALVTVAVEKISTPQRRSR